MVLSEKASQEFMKTAMEASRNHLVEYATLLEPDFQSNWHIDLIADRLEQIENGKGKNLIITLPPRHSKSMLSQEVFTAWYLARNPKNRIISVGSTTRLASSFTTKARKNFDNPMTKMLFNNELNKKKKSTAHWETLLGGGMKSFGIQAGVSGESADLLICDDVIRNAEQANSKLVRDKIWAEYSQSASTRLLPNGKIIVIGTRWHLDDLIGRIIDNAEDSGDIDDWEVLNLPAIAEEDESFTLSDGRIVGRKAGEALHPQRYSVETLEKKKRSMGVSSFLTMYQNTPVTAETQIFKRDWFQHVTEKEVKSVEDSQGQKMLRLLAIDAAFSKSDTADYTGFTDIRIDREGNLYIKTWRKRLSPTELVDELIKQQRQFTFDRMFMEGQMYDVAIQAYLNDKAKQVGVSIPMETISHNRATKDLRINAIEPYLKNGEMYFITNWCEDLETELLTYPKGKTDDVVDSLALCISGIKEIRRRAATGNVLTQPINYSL